MCNTSYKSCVNRYIKQNSIYITCVIIDISHVSIDILSRIASTLKCVLLDISHVSIDILGRIASTLHV